MFEQRARELLQRRGLLGVVCTLRAAGSPQANPVWFRLEHDEIRIWTDEQRRWVANLKRDPRIAFSVSENQRPWASLSVRGRAELDRLAADQAADEIRMISARYLPPEEIEAYVEQWPQTRSIVRIEPTAIFIAQAFEDPVAHRRV